MRIRPHAIFALVSAVALALVADGSVRGQVRGIERPPVVNSGVGQVGAGVNVRQTGAGAIGVGVGSGLGQTGVRAGVAVTGQVAVANAQGSASQGGSSNSSSGSGAETETPANVGDPDAAREAAEVAEALKATRTFADLPVVKKVEDAARR